MTRLPIDKSGRIALPASLAKGLGAGPLALVSHSPHHLLLSAQAGEGDVLLAGRLGVLSVADLLSFFNMFRKSGVLHFSLTGGSKDLTFRQGEVVGAASTFPDEELGAILLALGTIDLAALQQVKSTPAGRANPAQALAAGGHVAARDLVQAARVQVETIVYNLFAHHEGSFTFFEMADAASVSSLALSTPNLIMEGLRRIDERTLFLQRIPSLDAVPRAMGEAPAALPAEEARLLALIRRNRLPVRELLRTSGLGEFDALRLFHQLLERQLIAFDEVKRVAVDGVCGEILEIYNGLLVVLRKRIVQANPAYGEELRRFVRNLPAPFSKVLSEEVLCADGSVDGGRILARLANLDEDDRKRLLADALNELLLVACLAARRDLGAAAAGELVQRAQEIGRRIKTLTGRDV